MPIGKKKTALIDANRKKLNDQKIWISKRRYWLYSKNSMLDNFSTSPIFE
jgi:hypothetical protein